MSMFKKNNTAANTAAKQMTSSKISKILKPQPAPAPGNFDNVNTPQPAPGNFDNVNTQQATPAPEVVSQGITGTFLTDPEKADPYGHLKRSRSVLGQLNTKLGGR